MRPGQSSTTLHPPRRLAGHFRRSLASLLGAALMVGSLPAAGKPEGTVKIARDDAPDIEVKGRVVFRAAFEDGLAWNEGLMEDESSRRLVLSVPDARAGLRVRLLPPLSLVVAADFGDGRAKLRDGYVQWKEKRWLARAGQFKLPLSSFNLESPWSMPLARRGTLHELLGDHMQLFGRRPGALGSVNGGGPLDPALTVSAFQSTTADGDLLVNTGPADLTAVARLAISPAGVEIAAVGQRRIVGSDARRLWLFGGDMRTEIDLDGGGLRLWAEGFVGSSFQDFMPTDDAHATFITGRALGAWRRGGVVQGAPYVEGFATAGLLEPDTATVDDLLWEGIAGVNAGHWRRTRLGLQVELVKTARNFPTSLFAPSLVVTQQVSVILGAGAAF